jgi:hypothetical protein
VPDAKTVSGVLALFAVFVPVAVDSQYQVSPAGALPLALIVTPRSAHCGELEVGFAGVAGSGFTVKFEALVAVPPGVVTLIGPVVAPDGNTAVIVVELTTLKEAAFVPLNLTAVALVKLVPVRVTIAPLPPQALVGEKLAIVGVACMYVKEILSTAAAGLLPVLLSFCQVKINLTVVPASEAGKLIVCTL